MHLTSGIGRGIDPHAPTWSCYGFTHHIYINIWKICMHVCTCMYTHTNSVGQIYNRFMMLFSVSHLIMDAFGILNLHFLSFSLKTQADSVSALKHWLYIYILLLNCLDKTFYFMYINNVVISYVCLCLFWNYVNHNSKKTNHVMLTGQLASFISNTKSMLLLKSCTMYELWYIKLLTCSETY